MKNHIFSHSDYKGFLREAAGAKRQRNGVNAAIAKALNCQPTYVSQVIHGHAHFSLEQVEILGRFFGLPPDGQKYFRLLLLKDRAGTKELRSIYADEVAQFLESRLDVQKRLGSVNKLSEEDKARFYSSWHYGAFHIAVTIPELQTRNALAKYFLLPVEKVNGILEFLIGTGLIQEKAGKLGTGTMEMRLGKDSANILKHHTNWRVRAIDSLDSETSRELHYSAVISLSSADVLKLKDHMLDFIKQNLAVVKESKEEELFCYTIDFFCLRRSR